MYFSKYIPLTGINVYYPQVKTSTCRGTLFGYNAGDNYASRYDQWEGRWHKERPVYQFA